MTEDGKLLYSNAGNLGMRKCTTACTDGLKMEMKLELIVVRRH